MKKILIIVFAIFFVSTPCFAMLKLSEFRALYPQYNDLTDYELSTALHRSRYADMPYADFAVQFGGPLVERDRITPTINGTEVPFRRYINTKLGCSFFYPEDLIFQDEKSNKLLTVIFYDEQFPFITLSAEKLTQEVSNLFKSLYDSKMSDQEFGRKFYSDENISLTTFKRVYVVNNPGLESSYCYRIRHFDTEKYIFIHKLDVQKNNIRYKLEITTPLYETPEDAKAAHKILQEAISIILNSFSLT